MTFNRRIAYWGVAAVVATSALGAVVWTSQKGAEAPEELVQLYSTKCQTSGGVCYVAAQPVGSACVCGGKAGTIIP
jgi:archaellin